MYTIPKDLVAEWDRLKKNLVGSVDKADDMSQPALKRQVKTQLTGLLDQFDQGLKAKMKTAANAKTDADARKAAKVVFDTAGEYSAKIRDTSAKYPDPLKTAIEPYVDKIAKLLAKIRQHALASAQSRAPITFHKELDQIAAGLAKGAAEVQSAGKQKYQLDKAQQTKLEDYFVHLNMKLKPLVLKPKEARSENELYVMLGEMRRWIDVYRTKDFPDWWKQQKTMPGSAAELPKRMEKLFVTMGTTTDGLIKQLKTALSH
jgi:hypothetical protein